MTDPNPIARLREALDSTEPPTIEAWRAARDALAQLEAEREQLAASYASLERRHVELGAEADKRIAELSASLAKFVDQEVSRLEELQADASKAGNCYGSPELTLLELIELVDIKSRKDPRFGFRPEVARSALELMQSRAAKLELRVRDLESQLSALRAPETAPECQACDGLGGDREEPGDPCNACLGTGLAQLSGDTDEPETAPVAGELAEAIATLKEVDALLNQATRAQIRPAIAAAEKWAALQLNTGPAPRTTRLLWVFEGELGPNGDYCTDHAPIGWLPLDSLPALPPTEESDDADP